MKKTIFGALLICGLLSVPMAQAAKTRAPKVHRSKKGKKHARLAKARKHAKNRKSV